MDFLCVTLLPCLLIVCYYIINIKLAMPEPNNSEQTTSSSFNDFNLESFNQKYDDLARKYGELSQVCNDLQDNEIKLTSEIESLKTKNDSLIQQYGFASTEYELMQHDIMMYFKQTSPYIRISTQYQELFAELISILRPKTENWKSTSIESRAKQRVNNESGQDDFPNKDIKNAEPQVNLNKMLDKIEQSIIKEGPSKKLLFEKASILVRKSKFHKARQLLRTISNDTSDREFSEKAFELLLKIKDLQQESQLHKTKELICKLHEIADKYNYKLCELAKLEGNILEHDIPSLVRQEARRARTAELPMLSYELIKETLEGGQASPWLILGQASSLNMMGQRSKALNLLGELKETVTGEKIKDSINKQIKDIKSDSESRLSKKFFYLQRQAKAVANNIQHKMQFADDDKTLLNSSEVKSLIYKEAITCFKSNPDISLTFVNTILDYFPNDGASIQLKGEALFSLGRFDEAVQTWAKLLDSDNEEISHKASISISNCLGKEANLISIKKSKKEAILFYIKNLLKYNLDPLPNSKILKILEELSPESNIKDNPELQQHQAQLTFDSLLLECIRTY